MNRRLGDTPVKGDQGPDKWEPVNVGWPLLLVVLCASLLPFLFLLWIVPHGCN